MEKVLAILKLAVEKEQVRRDAYLKAARDTSNQLAKATFEALAKDEDTHAHYLQSYYNEMVATAGWPDARDLMHDADSLAVVREIFKYANAQIENAGCCEEGLTEVYDAAIAAEGEAVHFYKDALAHATDEKARAFFQMLVDAESRHQQLLSETQEFLNDTSKWFFDEEMWIVEG